MLSFLLAAVPGLLSLGIHLFQWIAKSRNSPAMVANAEATQLQTLKDAATSDVASGNLDALRKDVSS